MSVDSSKGAQATTRRYPDITWGPLGAGLLVLFGFGIVPPVASLLVTFLPRILGWDSIRADEWLLNDPVANFLFILLAEAMTILALVWFMSYKRFSFMKATGLRKPRWLDLGYAVVAFVVYILIFMVFTLLLQAIVPLDTTQEQALGYEKGISGASLVMAAISLVVLPPIVEELFFRGFFFGTLRSRGASFMVSAIITSAVFGLMHLTGGVGGSLIWIAFVDTFILSLVLCYVRERTGSIWASILVHALKNSVAFVNLFIIAST